MDFGDMDDEVLPVANVDQIINEITESDNCMTEEIQTKPPPTVDNCTEQMTNSGDGVANSKLEPFATTSKSKQTTVTSETKKGIQEFVRILRPHLPRKSKNKAYKMLQNIAKGIIATDNSFQRAARQKKPKKRPLRKPKVRNNKTKSLVVRRNARSMFGSSDSCVSEVSCPRCGYNGCRLPKY